MHRRWLPCSLLVLAALLAFLAVPASAATAGWDDGFERVTASTATQHFELHGGTLAWLSKAPAGFNIVLTDLERGGEDIVTAIPSVEGRDVKVECLSFDGRWVAWCDDRFGTLDVFALDTASGRLVRVTDTGARDIEASLGGGRLVWSSNDVLWMRDLANGTSWPVDTGPGAAREPVLAGETLAWIRLDGLERYVVAADLAGGGQRILSQANGTYAHRLAGEGNLLAWESYILRIPDQPQKGFEATVVQAAEVGGTVVNLTRVQDFQAGRGSELAVKLGGQRIAWLDPTLRERDLLVYDWATGEEERLQSKAHAITVSDRFVVAFASDAGFAEGHLVSRAWTDGNGGKDAGWSGGLGALACAVAVAASLRRRPA